MRVPISRRKAKALFIERHRRRKIVNDYNKFIEETCKSIKLGARAIETALQPMLSVLIELRSPKWRVNK